MGASPGAAVALTKMNAEIDVRDVLPSIRVPTLVIHRAGDMCLKVEEGLDRLAWDLQFELDGIDHLPFVGDQDEILEKIEDFVAGIRESQEHDRVLATVMNVKLVDVGSFRSRSDLGGQMRQFIRWQLDNFRGREISYGNGELLATFDGPARGIRCAAAIVTAADRAGVKLKTGLHTGECDVARGLYSGFAVELGRRIAADSDTGDILVSRTVKDLVAGSGLVFEESGLRSFDGIEGEWRLFKVVL